MPINILMPALSPTMEKGNLAKWLKKEGDKVKSGDVIAEIETDKATMEVEAVDEGILAKIVVPEGTADVPVNQLIALIAGEGEDPKSVSAAGARAPAAKPQAPPPAPAPPARAPQAPAPRRSGSRAGGAVSARGDRRPRPAPSPTAPAGRADLRLARWQGASPRKPGSTSSACRVPVRMDAIVEKDVRAAIAGGGAKPAAPGSARAAAAAKPRPQPRGSGADASADQVKAMFEPGSYEEIPHDGMRKTIAKRLIESKQTIPHFYLTLDCELDALMALRPVDFREVGGDGPGLLVEAGRKGAGLVFAPGLKPPGGEFTGRCERGGLPPDSPVRSQPAVLVSCVRD